ncbi:MAG TPA: APC family permease [Actinomycetota bacterium]|nr:APC family permease [Actinomycetota bacterium]
MAQTIERTEETPPKPGKRGLLPHSTGYGLKRAILGKPLPTSALAHERLGKPTALAVFASDNLSSVAYATEEILKVLVPAAGIAAFAFLMPITVGILAVLAILLFSYRQTIKAYPTAGGAYIVTKDNFGLLPAQVAGVALLTDYVLTVAVSASAGIAAITSAFPSTYPFRVEMTLFCIWFIAWGNLRGVRESGRMFAIPTYFFIVMMFLLLGTGLVRAFLSSGLPPVPVPHDAELGTSAITLFLILHAFSSGGAAVTGVEAISNGVPAFKPPEWRNARTTLMWMGTTLGVMFLGLSYIAMKLRVVPSETKTVISEVGRAVFGGGPLGYALFLALQIATTLILVLAANTSFADFPRLANFHAGDNFMPRQLTKRGHRLVFSNGIVGLAIAATALVLLTRADVHRLIPLYAIGVFTSFTLSQGGMAKRHLRIKEEGWRIGLLINGVGALTTAIVTIVIAATKFREGAWAVMLFVPIMVWLLVRMNHMYEREHRELDADLPVFDRSKPIEPPSVVVLVDDLDRPTLHALQYAKTIRTRRVVALHVDTGAARSRALRERWDALGASSIPLEIVDRHESVPETVTGYVRTLPGDTDVSVIMPAPGDPAVGERIRRTRLAGQISKELLDIEGARLTVVRDHPGPGHAPATPRIAARRGHRAIVLVDKADRATMRAVKYALSLGADEVYAVHAAADHEAELLLIDRWMELRMPIPLDVIECWDRNVPRSLEQYVVELMSHRYEVTVVMPRRDYATRRQRILHDRTSRRIARAVGRYEHVDIAVVPYFFRHADGRNGHGATGRPPDVSLRGASVPSTDGATGTPPDGR